jgi:ABC-2 type transport system permease protein
MGKILRVAQREYVETVKTRVFLLSVVLTPLFMVIVLLFVSRVQQTAAGPRASKEIAVTDLSGELCEEFKRVLEQYNAANPERQILLKGCDGGEPDPSGRISTLKQSLLEGELDGYLVLAGDAVEGEGASHFYAKTRSVADIQLFSDVQDLVNDAVVGRRLSLHDLSRELIGEVRRRAPVEHVDISAKGEKKRETMVVLMVPFFFLFLMFTGVSGTSQGMLTSVIEEKSSRVVEVLLSALSPLQLMAGKITGLAAVGLTVVGVWAVTVYLVAASRGIGDVVSARILCYFIVYYILGFLLMASLFSAAGSACNTLREAQTLMGPLMILLILPMVAWFYIAQHPEGPLAVILSFIPPVTPMVMILRISVLPELAPVQIIGSILVLAASIPVVMWASSKIFRTGVLMYGKPPSLRELTRWVRYR